MKKDIFWNSIGTAAWSFLSLALLIIVTRINGIYESGVFSFSFAFAMIIYVVCCYGGRAYQVSDHKKEISTTSYISLRLVTSLLALTGALLFIFLNDYGLDKALLLVVLVGHRIFDAIADVFYAVLQKQRHLYIAGKSMFYKSIISLILFLTIDLATSNLLFSALTLPFVSLLFIIFYDYPESKKYEKFTVKFNPRDSRRILKVTFLAFSISVIVLVFANIARYFIDLYHPNLQGYFGIIIMPLTVVILLFSFVLNPAILRLTEMYSNQEFKELRKIILKIIYLLLAVTLILCVGVYLFGSPILKILFGIDFSEFIFDIMLVIIIGFILSITSLFTNIAIIARKLRVTSFVYLATNITLVVLCALLVEKLEIRGAIISYIIASFTQMMIIGVYYLNLTSSQKPSKKS